MPLPWWVVAGPSGQRQSAQARALSAGDPPRKKPEVVQARLISLTSCSLLTRMSRTGTCVIQGTSVRHDGALSCTHNCAEACSTCGLGLWVYVCGLSWGVHVPARERRQQIS